MSDTVSHRDFDTTNRAHVEWLQRLTRFIQEMNPTATNNLKTILENNPFGKKIDPVTFIDTHAIMSIKYAGEVLMDKGAYIPSSLH